MADNPLNLRSETQKSAREGLDRLLLAPVFLIHEIFAVFVPGVLFILLLLFKRNHAIVTALQSDLLGYRTKLAISVLFGYVVGKVFNIPATYLLPWSIRRCATDVAKPGSKQQKNARQTFVGAVFPGPTLFGTEHTLDYFVLALMNASFQVSTGMVLVVSSLFPGDGFRRIEALLGIALCILGYRAFLTLPITLIGLLGIGMSGTLQKLIPGNFAEAFDFATKLAAAQLPAPQPKQAQPQVQVAPPEEP